MDLRHLFKSWLTKLKISKNIPTNILELIPRDIKCEI